MPVLDHAYERVRPSSVATLNFVTNSGAPSMIRLGLDEGELKRHGRHKSQRHCDADAGARRDDCDEDAGARRVEFGPFTPRRSAHNRDTMACTSFTRDPGCCDLLLRRRTTACAAHPLSLAVSRPTRRPGASYARTTTLAGGGRWHRCRVHLLHSSRCCRHSVYGAHLTAADAATRTSARLRPLHGRASNCRLVRNTPVVSCSGLQVRWPPASRCGRSSCRHLVLRLHDNELYPAITMPTPHYYVVIAAPEVLGGADCASGTMRTSQPAGACVRSAGTASSVICLSKRVVK